MNPKYRMMSIIARGALLAFAWAAGAALAAPPAAAPTTIAPDAAPAAGAPAPDAPPADFKTLDQEVQGLKKDVIDLNKDLFVLEEELLFPANTQVALYVSMDVGTFFALDSVTVKIDNKEVKNYLYTAREADALLKGGVITSAAPRSTSTRASAPSTWNSRSRTVWPSISQSSRSKTGNDACDV
jgi:hypothetical protein